MKKPIPKPIFKFRTDKKLMFKPKKNRCSNRRKTDVQTEEKPKIKPKKNRRSNRRKTEDLPRFLAIFQFFDRFPQACEKRPERGLKSGPKIGISIIGLTISLVLDHQFHHQFGHRFHHQFGLRSSVRSPSIPVLYHVQNVAWAETRFSFGW